MYMKQNYTIYEFNFRYVIMLCQQDKNFNKNNYFQEHRSFAKLWYKIVINLTRFPLRLMFVHS